jgi:hypothetical protein
MGLEPLDRLFLEENPPLRRFVYPGDEVKDSGLSRAVRADEADDLLGSMSIEKSSTALRPPK